MLRGASAEALEGLTGKLGKSGTLAEAAKTGEELFGVVRILRSDVALRRVLTDSSVDPEARRGLADTVFGSAVGESTMKIVSDAAGRRWTASGDLPDVLERLAVLSTVRSAGKDGSKVGDELFGVRRMIDGHPELRSALSDQTRTVEDRTALLVREALGRRQGTVGGVLEGYLQLAAEALDEAVATVHTARELTSSEKERLAEALTKQYGSQVQLHVVVDPSLVGGMRVQIGDDVIDGTVSGRLEEAGRKLAS